MLVLDWLTQQAISRGDRLALSCNGQTWTYAQLAQQVTKLATLLRNQGIMRSQYVAVLLANRAEYVFLVHALARIGAIAVLLNTRLSAAEISWQLEHSRCCWLIHDQKNQELAHEAIRITQTALGDDSFLQAIAIDAFALGVFADQGDQLKVNPRQANLAGTITVPHDQEIDLNAVQAIVYTSGTTGKPKGVQLTFGNHFLVRRLRRLT
jgi:O-succinylbenzoic acid--CoA ligase